MSIPSSDSPMPPAIPRGVADLFGAAATARRDAEQSVRELARSWGYTEVIPPTFEYAETLSREAGTRLGEELYRFIDRDGKALALRPDLTIPAARIAGSKLFDQPLPLRMFYAGPAFRYGEPRAGRMREFWQAGIELMGASTVEADAEVLSLAVKTLEATNLEHFRFSLGHLGFFHGLIELLELDQKQVAGIQSALDRKSRNDLAVVAGSLDLGTEDRLGLMSLLELNGSDWQETLQRAGAFARHPLMGAAIERLSALHMRLGHFGIDQHFELDMADVRGMEYYTGITFKAYTQEIGFSIVNGGRYDNLIGHFGPSQPAVGCAFYLDRILLAQTRQRGVSHAITPDVLLMPCPCGEFVQLAEAARSRGLTAVLVLGTEDSHTDMTTVRCTCNGSVEIGGGDDMQSMPVQTWIESISSA